MTVFLRESLVTINSTKESAQLHRWMDMFSVLWGKSLSVIAFLNIIQGVDEFRGGLIPRSETPLIIYLFYLKLRYWENTIISDRNILQVILIFSFFPCKDGHNLKLCKGGFKKRFPFKTTNPSYSYIIFSFWHLHNSNSDSNESFQQTH